jgi:hypothetical protein
MVNRGGVYGGDEDSNVRMLVYNLNIDTGPAEL